MWIVLGNHRRPDILVVRPINGYVEKFSAKKKISAISSAPVTLGECVIYQEDHDCLENRKYHYFRRILTPRYTQPRRLTRPPR